MSKCRHDRIQTIYGDRINAANGDRSECVACGATFPDFAESRAALPATPAPTSLVGRIDEDGCCVGCGRSVQASPCCPDYVATPTASCQHNLRECDCEDPREVGYPPVTTTAPKPDGKPDATGVEQAKAAFYEAAREMMQAKRDEAASADFDNLLGLAVVMTTKAAHRAHYDLLNVEAAKRAARDGSK